MEGQVISFNLTNQKGTIKTANNELIDITKHSTDNITMFYSGDIVAFKEKTYKNLEGRLNKKYAIDLYITRSCIFKKIFGENKIIKANKYMAITQFRTPDIQDKKGYSSDKFKRALSLNQIIEEHFHTDLSNDDKKLLLESLVGALSWFMNTQIGTQATKKSQLAPAWLLLDFQDLKNILPFIKEKPTQQESNAIFQRYNEKFKKVTIKRIVIDFWHNDIDDIIGVFITSPNESDLFLIKDISNNGINTNNGFYVVYIEKKYINEIIQYISKYSTQIINPSKVIEEMNNFFN